MRAASATRRLSQPAGRLSACAIPAACAIVLATAAHAAQSAKLHVALTPKRLGGPAALRIAIQIDTPSGSVPSPLTALDLLYPGELGIATSGLGLAACTQAELEILGPDDCPANSRVGEGTATAEIPIGPELVSETAQVTIVRAPAPGGTLALRFYATGETPINAQIVFPGLLNTAPRHSRLHIDVPLVPSLPEGPNVAIVDLQAVLGPRSLTYYEHVHGRLIGYHPRGILLPDRCPRGGFRFTAVLYFEDGSHTSSSTAVPCPGHSGRRKHARRAAPGASRNAAH